MPTLADELRADQDPRTRCKLCAWIEEQTKLVQAEWDAALADRAYTHTSISRALVKRNAPISKSSVETHRGSRHRQAASVPSVLR